MLQLQPEMMIEATQEDQVAETELEEESGDLAATRRAYILASLSAIGWYVNIHIPNRFYSLS